MSECRAMDGCMYATDNLRKLETTKTVIFPKEEERSESRFELRIWEQIQANKRKHPLRNM